MFLSVLLRYLHPYRKGRTVHRQRIFSAGKFLSAAHIEDIAFKCFDKICKGSLNDLDFSEFVSRIAAFYNDINYIHPFREGNGRVQRIYFTQLIRAYGYDINFADVDTDELMIATIQASQGVMDFLVDFFRIY